MEPGKQLFGCRVVAVMRVSAMHLAGNQFRNDAHCMCNRAAAALVGPHSSLVAVAASETMARFFQGLDGLV
jgi:hypothetical protein